MFYKLWDINNLEILLFFKKEETLYYHRQYQKIQPENIGLILEK